MKLKSEQQICYYPNNEHFSSKISFFLNDFFSNKMDTTQNGFFLSICKLNLIKAVQFWTRQFFFNRMCLLFQKHKKKTLYFVIKWGFIPISNCLFKSFILVQITYHQLHAKKSKLCQDSLHTGAGCTLWPSYYVPKTFITHNCSKFGTSLSNSCQDILTCMLFFSKLKIALRINIRRCLKGNIKGFFFPSI